MKAVRAGLATGASALLFLFWSVQARAQVDITVGLPGIELRADVAPPPLPVYAQPPVPEPGYIWTPGYWRYGDQGYFWVPGTWVEPPTVGYLWTPGYWGWNSGVYVFNEGYWGPHVGFYGGVNYGYGYGGSGYAGGRWSGDHFEYNSSVSNVHNTSIHNTYNERVVNTTTVNRVSYNGGPQGVHASATAEELSAAREQHAAPTTAQVQHHQQAAQNENLRAATNKGRPAIAATPRAGAYSDPGVIAARPTARPVAVAAHQPDRAPVQSAPRQQSAPRPQSRPAPQEHEHAESRPQAAPSEEHREQR